jgi:hypothetical protein
VPELRPGAGILDSRLRGNDARGDFFTGSENARTVGRVGGRPREPLAFGVQPSGCPKERVLFSQYRHVRTPRSKKGTVLATPRAGAVPFLAASTQTDRFWTATAKQGQTDTSPPLAAGMPLLVEGIVPRFVCVSPGFAQPLHDAQAVGSGILRPAPIRNCCLWEAFPVVSRTWHEWHA